jgi:hypothetical protein
MTSKGGRPSYDELPGPIILPLNSSGQQSKLERTEVVVYSNLSELSIYLNLCKQSKSLVRNLQSKKEYNHPEQLSILAEGMGVATYGSNLDYNWRELKERGLGESIAMHGVRNKGIQGVSQAEMVKRSLWEAQAK